jgi:hypothetical protein
VGGGKQTHNKKKNRHSENLRKRVQKLEDTDQHEEKNAITVFNPELQPSTDNCYRAYYLRKKKHISVLSLGRQSP